MLANVAGGERGTTLACRSAPSETQPVPCRPVSSASQAKSHHAWKASVLGLSHLPQPRVGQVDELLRLFTLRRWSPPPSDGGAFAFEFCFSASRSFQSPDSRADFCTPAQLQRLLLLLLSLLSISCPKVLFHIHKTAIKTSESCELQRQIGQIALIRTE